MGGTMESIIEGYERDVNRLRNRCESLERECSELFSRLNEAHRLLAESERRNADPFVREVPVPEDSPVPERRNADPFVREVPVPEDSLLKDVMAKVVRHRDETGNTDALNFWMDMKDALTGEPSLDALRRLTQLCERKHHNNPQLFDSLIGRLNGMIKGSVERSTV